ncbi:acyl carrier protein [Streptomyces pratens]|uniref:Acyl carrier protein n=1 Tax=Streptomyces pratens TaxID=887456 RepID=A0ABW1LYL7_9ACTN
MSPTTPRPRTHSTCTPGTCDADLATPGPDDAFRDALEMDSLDFLTCIEILGERTGIRIDDEDTPQLTTLSGSVDLLVAHGK